MSRIETIGIAREAIAAGRTVVALPCANPSIGPTLEVQAMHERSYILTITDPMGAHVWSVELIGKHISEMMK